jgi:cobalt-zinc-cadmium efflux system protein
MSQQRRLTYLLCLNAAMIAGLLLVGLASHSVSVIAAGGDFIADSCAILLGILAVHLRDSHGKQKAPVYVAFINATLLLGITTFVLIEAISRLVKGTPEIHGLPVLIVSLISALLMVVGVVILGTGAGKEDLHMRSVLLDTIADGAAAAGVAVVGGIIFVTNNYYWLDSVAAIIISVVIISAAYSLVRDALKEV